VNGGEREVGVGSDMTGAVTEDGEEWEDGGRVDSTEVDDANTSVKESAKLRYIRGIGQREMGQSPGRGTRGEEHSFPPCVSCWTRSRFERFGLASIVSGESSYRQCRR
jgi:hypothetical protein